MMRSLAVIVMFLAIVPTAVASLSSQIMDRATLSSILGGNEILEDFESFDIGVGDAVNLDIASLDVSSIANGQGPGLVEDGAVYTDPSSVKLQWNGDDYYNLQTKTLLSNGNSGDIEISYTTDVSAMGLDLRAYPGYEYEGTVYVYDLDNSLVVSTDFALSSGGSENVFFGWQHDLGIGRVRIRSYEYNWSPIIDNHAYGIPEPATLSLLGFGGLALLRRRQRVR